MSMGCTTPSLTIMNASAEQNNICQMVSATGYGNLPQVSMYLQGRASATQACANGRWRRHSCNNVHLVIIVADWLQAHRLKQPYLL